MVHEIEIEFKNLLTKREFDHLTQAMGFPQTGTVQENFYFETDDFQLRKYGCALRIREKHSKYVLTLKEPHEEGLLETHDSLTEEEANAWIKGQVIPKEYTTSQLDNLNIAVQDLRYYGNLITERRTIEYKNTLLVLDFSQYNGKEDFELELEAKSYKEGEVVFQKLLQDFEIPQRKTQNKIERFFHSLPE